MSKRIFCNIVGINMENCKSFSEIKDAILSYYLPNYYPLRDSYPLPNSYSLPPILYPNGGWEIGSYADSVKPEVKQKSVKCVCSISNLMVKGCQFDKTGVCCSEEIKNADS